MKQIVVISGKGGTGKTIITGAFASLAENKVVADCDVDAADLHLLLQPTIKEREIFKSGVTAFIDKNKCNKCSKCIQLCRFSAIKSGGSASGGNASSDDFVVDPIACEGCSFCKWICPEGAIQMQESISGEWFISNTRFGPLVHAKLGIAEENSGKLVSLVRKIAKEIAESSNNEWVIIDGAPGIGCPVIASLSGIDCAVVVTEPTLSGLHDADRVIGVARHFRVNTKLIINKYDLNLDVSRKIEEYCKSNQIELIGKIGFDTSIVEAMVKGKTIIEYQGRKASKEIRDAWKRLQESLSN